MNSEKIEVPSFSIDHTTLKAGLYLREVVESNNLKIWDLRFVAPADKKPLSAAVMHTIEHIFALKLRYIMKPQYIGFYTYGCKTGFAFVSTADLDIMTLFCGIKNVIGSTIPLIKKSDIPCLTEKECGNPNLFALEATNKALHEYWLALDKQFSI